MAKINLKTLKICKLCEQQHALSVVQTEVTGLVNKKPMTGSVCLGYVGKMLCGWKPMQKV